MLRVMGEGDGSCGFRHINRIGLSAPEFWLRTQGVLPSTGVSNTEITYIFPHTRVREASVKVGNRKARRVPARSRAPR